MHELSIAQSIVQLSEQQAREHHSSQIEEVELEILRQVVHRIPRRFLFIRWGTKALRQEIVPSNPHTRIVYSEYVKIER